MGRRGVKASRGEQIRNWTKLYGNKYRILQKCACGKQSSPILWQVCARCGMCVCENCCKDVPDGYGGKVTCLICIEKTRFDFR